MSIQFANNIKIQIANKVDTSATQIGLVSLQGLPALSDPDDYILLSLIDISSGAYEIVKVTSVSTFDNTLTVQRAQEDTLALPFEPLDEVRSFLTKGGLEALRQEIVVGQIPSATEESFGLVELATQAEMDTGTPFKAATAAKVKQFVEDQGFIESVVNASAPALGLISLVSEAIPGIATIANLRQGDGIQINPVDSGASLEVRINGTEQAVFQTNGYMVVYSGLIIQWGQTVLSGANAATTVSLPLAYPTAGLVAVTSFIEPVDGTGFEGYSAQATFVDAATLQLFSNKANIYDHTVSWIAFGH